MVEHPKYLIYQINKYLLATVVIDYIYICFRMPFKFPSLLKFSSLVTFGQQEKRTYEIEVYKHCLYHENKM